MAHAALMRQFESTVGLESGGTNSSSAAPGGGSDGLQAEVEQVLALLNAMGTCSPPPDREEDLDWNSGTPLLFSFYTMSTIGYGDINVMTAQGRQFTIAYSIVAMWVFGWFSDALTVVLERRGQELVDAAWSAAGMTRRGVRNGFAGRGAGAGADAGSDAGAGAATGGGGGTSNGVVRLDELEGALGQGSGGGGSSDSHGHAVNQLLGSATHWAQGLWKRCVKGLRVVVACTAYCLAFGRQCV